MKKFKISRDYFNRTATKYGNVATLCVDDLQPPSVVGLGLDGAARF